MVRTGLVGAIVLAHGLAALATSVSGRASLSMEGVASSYVLLEEDAAPAGATGGAGFATGAASSPPVDEDAIEAMEESVSALQPLPSQLPLSPRMVVPVASKLPSEYSGEVHLRIALSLTGVPPAYAPCHSVVAAAAELLDPVMGVAGGDFQCVGPTLTMAQAQEQEHARVSDGDHLLTGGDSRAPWETLADEQQLRTAHLRALHRTSVVYFKVVVRDGSYTETLEAQLAAMLDDQRLQSNLARHGIAGVPSYFVPPTVLAHYAAPAATGGAATPAL